MFTKFKKDSKLRKMIDAEIGLPSTRADIYEKLSTIVDDKKELAIALNHYPNLFLFQKFKKFFLFIAFLNFSSLLVFFCLMPIIGPIAFIICGYYIFPRAYLDLRRGFGTSYLITSMGNVSFLYLLKYRTVTLTDYQLNTIIGLLIVTTFLNLAMYLRLYGLSLKKLDNVEWDELTLSPKFDPE